MLILKIFCDRFRKVITTFNPYIKITHLTLIVFKSIINMECDFMNKYNIKELAEKLVDARNVNLNDVKL